MLISVPDNMPESTYSTTLRPSRLEIVIVRSDPFTSSDAIPRPEALGFTQFIYTEFCEGFGFARVLMGAARAKYGTV